MKKPLALMCLLLAHAAPAGAVDDAADIEELLGQAIVTTASKGSESETTAPATSHVITAEELRDFGLRSLDEALNYLSLGMMTSSSLHAAEIGARGVLISGDYGNHVLLLVDGHVLNEPWNGTAYFERGAGIPFEMIDHIEVVLGPGSVLYGSQAMFGVINVVTKRAKNFSGLRLVAEADTALPPRTDEGPAAGGFVEGLGAGVRVGAGYGREFSLAGRPSELTLGLDYYRNHGPRWALGPQPYGEDAVTSQPKDFGPRARPGVWGGYIENADSVEVPAAYARFTTGDFTLALRASAFRRSTVYPDGIAASSADFDDPHNHELDRFLNLDLTQRLTLSPRVDVVLRAYGDLYAYEWYNRTSAVEDCPGLNGCERSLKGTGRALGTEVRGQFQWPVLRASTLLGVDAKLGMVHDRLNIEELVTGRRFAPIGGDRTDGTVAPYVAQVLSPNSWLDVNLGLRLDHDTRFGNKLSPRTALGVTPWEGGRMKLIYAEAFRAPSPYEMTYHDPTDQVWAPSLGAETVRSVEGSFEQRYRAHRWMVGLFRSWWTGLIGSTALTDAERDAAIETGALAPGVDEAYRRSNLGELDNYGMNAAYDGAAAGRRVRFGANVTVAMTRENAGDGSNTRALAVAPQTFGNARFAYAPSPELPVVGVALRFSDRRLANRAHDGGFAPMPVAPPLLAVRLTASGPVPSLRSLTYRVGAEYSFTRWEPYVIGAATYATDAVPTAELAPMRRAQLFVGFEYAFEPMSR